MSTMQAIAPATVVSAPAHDADGTTRRRVLELVATEGPVTAGELAGELGLTSAAVRRHLALLEDDGKIAVHAGHASGHARRGRPARRYVASAGGQSELAGGYSELAAQALRYLRDVAGPEAVAAFAAQRYEAVVRRYAPVLTATDPQDRAGQLAGLLSADGYAASLRPVPNPRVPTVQLCQGHCPVQNAAEEFPELCEAEARAFAGLLGTHVQRLATIAGGAHACVTNVPLTPAPQASPTTQTTQTTQTPHPAGHVSGTQEGSR